MKKAIHPLVIGNWKMNPQSIGVAKRLATEIKNKTLQLVGVDVVLVPPFVYLSTVEQVRNGSKKFALGAQDVHWEKTGAHTGEVSLPMLESLGITYVIVGHSERRAAGETNEKINKKLKSTIKTGMTAVLCVGEKKRDSGARYLNLVEKQIREACSGISKMKLNQLVVAYEPIWAIGTGNNATPEDAHEMKLFVKKILSDIYGRNQALGVRILYGGSVNPKNAEELISEGMVDGFLVGGASLQADDFTEIIKATL